MTPFVIVASSKRARPRSNYRQRNRDAACGPSAQPVHDLVRQHDAQHPQVPGRTLRQGRLSQPAQPATARRTDAAQ
jgi:hypothetical protein